MLSPAKPLVAFSSPLASDISCEFLIWSENWTRTGADLTSRRQISSQEIPSLLAFPPPRTRTLQDHQYMICYVILTRCCLSGSFVSSHHPVCTVLLKCDPYGVKGDNEGALTGMRPRGFEDAAGGQLSVLRLTIAVILLQVNSERRHPSFTRLRKRNAK